MTVINTRSATNIRPCLYPSSLKSLLLFCGKGIGCMDIFNFQVQIFTSLLSLLERNASNISQPRSNSAAASQSASQPVSQSAVEQRGKSRAGAAEIFPLPFNMSALLSIGFTCFGNTTDPAFLPLFLWPLSSLRTILVECRD